VINSYQETLKFLYSQLPVYHHIGPAAYKNDLHNTLELCALIGNPQKKFKSIHVTGTNGKGSSSHMLAAILQSAKYKTGLYTSPHLKDFTERIKINGVDVMKDFVVNFVDRMKPAIEKIKPSFFELTVAMAFEYFAMEKVDIAVIEVGLGGRLDSTNIIDPEVSLITNIGYDHMDILGNTLVEIASEKAGIIKQKKPIVISERQPEVEKVFIGKATKMDSPIYFASDNISIAEKKSPGLEIHSSEMSLLVEPELKGHYQLKNIRGVIQIILIMRQLDYQLPDSSIVDGINKTVRLTGLKGRWQKISEKPTVICDTAHNAEGLLEILNQIKLTPHKKLRWVFGIVKDKLPEKVLSILPTNALYYFCQANIPRALSAIELLNMAKEKGLSGKVIPNVNDALQLAKHESSPEDLIMVGGSTFIVAEVNGL